MLIKYSPADAVTATGFPMRRLRAIACELDDAGRVPHSWHKFASLDVARIAVAASLTDYGLTAAEAALVVTGLGEDLAGLRLQLSKTPRDGLVIDQQRDALPPWPFRLCAVVVDAGAIAAGAVARLPVREPAGP